MVTICMYTYGHVCTVYCKDFNISGFKLHPTVLLMSYFNKLQLREFCKNVVGDSKHGYSSILLSICSSLIIIFFSFHVHGVNLRLI